MRSRLKLIRRLAICGHHQLRYTPFFDAAIPEDWDELPDWLDSGALRADAFAADVQASAQGTLQQWLHESLLPQTSRAIQKYRVVWEAEQRELARVQAQQFAQELDVQKMLQRRRIAEREQTVRTEHDRRMAMNRAQEREVARLAVLADQRERRLTVRLLAREQMRELERQQNRIEAEMRRATPKAKGPVHRAPPLPKR